MDKHAGRAPRTAGYALVEVLVSLFIIAVAMAVMLNATANSSLAAESIRDRTLGGLIARNVVIEFQTAKQWPEPGRSDDEVEMAGRFWEWNAAVIETQDPNIRRLDVEVTLPGREGSGGDPRIVGVLSAFLANPAPVAPAPGGGSGSGASSGSGSSGSPGNSGAPGGDDDALRGRG